MDPDKDKKISTLTTKDRRWWIIRFYDKRVLKFVFIDLKTRDYAVAQQLYKRWLFDKSEGATISAPRPVMGMSVHRAIFDFIFAPDITNNKNLEDVSAIHEQLVRGFGHKSIQQINEEDCRIYAERRRSELICRDIEEIALREIHRRIRRELKQLRSIARYARRWQRITANDMPDIQLNRIPTHMNYREMMGPIRTTGRKRAGRLGAWASVQEMMFRYRVQHYKAPTGS